MAQLSFSGSPRSEAPLASWLMLLAGLVLMTDAGRASAAASTAPPPAAAPAGDAPPLRVFRIGFTGVMCVRPPCPSAGVMAETALPGERARWPLWWGEGDPPIDADAAMRAHIRASWRKGECLRVQGRWSGGRLKAQRIIGRCGGLPGDR